MQCWQEQQICAGALLEMLVEWLGLETYLCQLPDNLIALLELF